MNWFDILKNAGLTQRQRQGISARQKDEDFIFEDDDDDCTQKIIDEYIRLCQKFYGETPHKIDIFGSYRHWYKIGEGSSISSAPAMLAITFPETKEANKAYCAFYNKFAQGRNLYPPKPEGRNYTDNSERIDDIHYTYTRVKRKDKDEPTSNFNYYATLYGPLGKYKLYDGAKIDIRFENIPEDAWT